MGPMPGWPWGGSSGGWPSWGTSPWGYPPGHPGRRPGARSPWEGTSYGIPRGDLPDGMLPEEYLGWGSAPRRRRSRARRPRPDERPGLEPARYVGGLLAWQGAAWLVLSAIGLCVWIVTLPSSLLLGSASLAMLWKSAELLGIALGAGVGAAQASFACRLRGRRGPRGTGRWEVTGPPGATGRPEATGPPGGTGAALRTTAAALRATAVGAGLAAAGVSVLMAASGLELLVLTSRLVPVSGRLREPAGRDMPSWAE